MSDSQHRRGRGRGERGRGRGRGVSAGNSRNRDRGNVDSANSEYQGQYHRGSQSADRSRGRGGRDYVARKVGYKLLESKSTASSREAVMFCHEENFIELLFDPSLGKDWVDLILTLLNNALKADESLHGYREVLKTALVKEPTTFLSTTCVQRFSGDLESESTKIDSLLISLGNYLDVFHHLCAMDPLISKTLIGHVKMVKQLLKGAVMDNEVFKGVYDQYSQATIEVDQLEKERDEIEKRKKEMRRTGRMVTEDRPAGDFREISVYPTEEDLIEGVQLRANRVDQAFESVDDYLDIQFRLLREDFVSTIRQGIQEFKRNPNLRGPDRFRSGDIKIYENFQIVAPNFGEKGMNYIVQIDKSSGIFQRIKWESTKRLMYGSLLCLSQDGFNTNNLFAVIAEMDSKVISKDGKFEIQFLPDSQMAFDLLPNQEASFMALESTAYFEAYKHVLKGMQKLKESNFPFSKHIVRTETKVSAPVYTRFIETSYRFITADNQVTNPVSIFRESGGKWPSAEILGFNESQYEAYKMALTKEFAIIQGPPGTGKTFIGLKIVETLLYNLYNVPYAVLDKLTAKSAQKKHALASATGNQSSREKLCPERRLYRMLVVCFTNHALDQFLEGMLNFCPITEMVRVGSRSKNELLAQCNIRNKRDRRVGQLGVTSYQLRNEKENFVENNSIDKLTKEMELTRECIIDYDNDGFLVGYPEFYYQLQDLGDALVDQGGKRDDTMCTWLQADVGTLSSRSLQLVENVLGGPGYEQVDQESIDIEGEAERELQNRRIDLGGEDDFMKRVRKDTSKVEQGQGGVEIDAEGFITVSSKRKGKKVSNTEIKERINSRDAMSEEMANDLHIRVERFEVDIIKDLSVPDRWRLYRYLVSRHQEHMAQKMTSLQKEYMMIVDQSENLRMQDDIDALKKAKVIGMTTTGAAKMQSVLQEVGPEIIIVEEAAEVLEAHIITALSKHCQHLILIGDHKQLKPNPTVYELAKNYHLDLSLFERMVNNGLPVKTLNIQHRMRPEVSKYIRGHIYDRLDDHSSVLNREAVEGVKSPVFFFNHNNPETSDEGTMSHSNKFEAQMVVELTRYLLRQNSYKPEDITIITMYTGQLLTIKQMMPKFEFEGVKITSVDNFQGEENKILIISLVRSNPKGVLGFVKIENRVCVSLSRAQYGMYVFGDFDLLSKGSTLWKKIVDGAKEANEFGSQLHLSCQLHNNPAVVEKPEDFNSKVPAGGCRLLCKAKLDCGHTCKMLCHSKDLKHEHYKCTAPCPKPLSPCNHSCPVMCHQKCPNCTVMLQKTLECGHTRNVACHLLYKESYVIPCLERCPQSLPCGHPCPKKCSEPCVTNCDVKVEQMCSKCMEMKEMPCHVATERLSFLTPDALKYSYRCDTPCNVTLACGHKCTGTCYNCSGSGHQKCIKKCNKTLKCGHICTSLCQDCTDSGGCRDCHKRCLIICSHESRCTRRCYEDCMFTIQTSNLKCQWGCKHGKCERDCGEPCSFIPCDKSCDKIMSCKQCKTGYPCVGMCGEICPVMCPQCDFSKKMGRFRQQLGHVVIELKSTTRWIVLEDCKHLVPEAYMGDLVYGVKEHTLVKCPYKDCDRWLLNTRRYASRTRPAKSISHEYVEPKKKERQTGKVVWMEKQQQKNQHQKKQQNTFNPVVPFQQQYFTPQPGPMPVAAALSIPPYIPHQPLPSETAKERRQRVGRGQPPPHAKWMELSGKNDRFYRELQTVQYELEELRTREEAERLSGPQRKRGETTQVRRPPRNSTFREVTQRDRMKTLLGRRHSRRDSPEEAVFDDQWGYFDRDE